MCRNQSVILCIQDFHVQQLLYCQYLTVVLRKFLQMHLEANQCACSLSVELWQHYILKLQWSGDINLQQMHSVCLGADKPVNLVICYFIIFIYWRSITNNIFSSKFSSFIYKSANIFDALHRTPVLQVLNVLLSRGEYGTPQRMSKSAISIF